MMKCHGFHDFHGPWWKKDLVATQRLEQSVPTFQSLLRSKIVSVSKNKVEKHDKSLSYELTCEA